MSVADWDAVAAAWDRYFDWNATCFQPLIDWCADAIDVRHARRVLDVAGGAGLPAIALAQRVAPGGTVLSVDASTTMVALATRRARSHGIANIEFREMDAHALDVADAAFDAVTCSCGLMLFDDPVRALREMRRALTPGGRFAFVVWDTPTKNPFLAISGRSALEVLALPRPERTDPGPFRFAEPGAFETVLTAGGFANAAVESRSMTMVYESVDMYLETSRTLAPKLGARVAALPKPDGDRYDAMVRDAVGPFVVGGRLHLAATALCASGVR